MGAKHDAWIGLGTFLFVLYILSLGGLSLNELSVYPFALLFLVIGLVLRYR